MDFELATKNTKNDKNLLFLQNGEKIILNPRDKTIMKIACNSNICLILTSNGSIYIMGTDKKDFGLFGCRNELKYAKKPILLDYFIRNNIFISDIAVSENIAIGLSGKFEQ